MNERTYRFERKFLVSGLRRHEIQAIIRLHPALFSEIYQPRYVHNIYLDTLEFDNYEDNMAGIGRRLKVRIRWYGSLFGEISQPTLELKIKDDLVGTKVSYPLQSFFFEPGFNIKDLRALLQASDLSDILRIQLDSLQASLVNSYLRSYYLSADGKFRVTVDDKMTFHRIQPFNNRFTHRVEDVENIVVELKYAQCDDDLARPIASRFPFRLTKNSKYATGLQMLHV